MDEAVIGGDGKATNDPKVIFEEPYGAMLSFGQHKGYGLAMLCEILAGGFVAIGDGPHIQEARMAARGLIGFYVGGMGAKGKNFYNDLFKRYGWVEEAEKIQDLFLGGQRNEAYEAVPDEYIELSALIGDEDHIKARLAKFKEVGVTHLNVNPVGPDPLGTIEKLKDWVS